MNNQITLFDRDSDYLESSTTDFNEENASFRVHASLIYKLGESLIADDVTALSELIKNSYDADATICTLNIDSNYEFEIDGEKRFGRIELIDDGCGMDLSAIVNGWLTLSNSPKKKMKREQKTTPKFHRYPLGDKGLGRLSVQKLGKYMEMTTKTAASNIEYTVVIPWGDFLKNTTIDQIPVKISEKAVENTQSYTKIIVFDLLDKDKWNEENQINILSNSINKIVSPFKHGQNDFSVFATVNGRVLESISDVFDELLSSARAKHSIHYHAGEASILSEFKNSFFYSRDILQKIVSSEFSLNGSALQDFFTSYKKELEPFSLCSENGVSIEAHDQYIEQGIIATASDQSSNDPGDFECEIYEYSLDPKYLDYLYENIGYDRIIERDEYRGFVDRFHGIKVVRDGFVVQGFGEGDGGDWLGLSSSSKTTGYFFDMRNDSVIGCVYLTGINNSKLRETTNREGFIEDEYYSAFWHILNGSIKRINRNRKKLNDLMKDYVTKSLAQTGTKSTDVLNYKPVIQQIKEQLSTSRTTASDSLAQIETVKDACISIKASVEKSPFVDSSTLKQVDELYRNIDSLSVDYSRLLQERDLLEKRVDAISIDFEKMSERIQDLFELAGLGLSVELFSHEFESSVRSIRNKNQQILASNEHQTVESLCRHISYVSYSLDALRKQMSYFNPGLKYVRAEKQIFSIKEFIESHQAFYSDRCNSKAIEFICAVDTDFNVRMNRGMLNQVFDNLFSNSEYWLDFSKKHGLIEKKEYVISVVERGIVVIWDNGLGISKDIETRLFDPFESKKENGRGLGLYIASGNLRYNSSRIRLLSERNIFGNLFKFEIDLSQVVV